ncbi:hypothetical protein [Pseudodesulfovibrio sp.]|uniref:hypothetical protein n=1 Tax=Pseudodesulfovibrio sp. TaxID=2035812 RepID=UPI002610D970|nr:hypothetical protein [Pseudodesulfovibrio sp.]MDD3312441.1 hypothetical protein [Pseudodesulfovibrio sp.]
MKRLLRLLISRRGIALIHLLIVGFIALVSFELYDLMSDTVSNAGEIEEILDTVAVILVAWGVALEERGTLMESLGAYAKGCPTVEKEADHASHIYGMAALLLGLFMEVVVEVVKVPDHVINTVGLEGVLFWIGIAFMAASVALLLHMNLELWRARNVTGMAQAA